MLVSKKSGRTIDRLKSVVRRTTLGKSLRGVYWRLKGIGPAAAPPSPLERMLLEEIAELEKTSPHASHHRYHLKRYAKTLDFLPDGTGKLLDLGGYRGLFSKALERHRRYSIICADYEHPEERFRFDIEKEPFPFQDNEFDVVLLMEVIEHMKEDPMHALVEVNRVLKIGGLFLITTPNTCSWKSIRRILNHEHPGMFVQYCRFGGADRHNREYGAREIRTLVEDAGFEIVRFQAVDVYDPPGIPIPGVADIMDRGDTTFCLARKVSAVITRMPKWLYWPDE